jgi:hypothetical protein
VNLLLQVLFPITSKEERIDIKNKLHISTTEDIFEVDFTMQEFKYIKILIQFKYQQKLYKNLGIKAVEDCLKKCDLILRTTVPAI